MDDLLHHYKVLKQFLDISHDAETPRKNASSRAAKARDKLLKLSSAQFRELSTDVFDELRRRIDELRSEPDFLLPKLNFHPKRNQARQKLSSLPQLRFRDLVLDISYEIERRNLHMGLGLGLVLGSVSAAAPAAAPAVAPSSSSHTVVTPSTTGSFKRNDLETRPLSFDMSSNLIQREPSSVSTGGDAMGAVAGAGAALGVAGAAVGAAVAHHHMSGPSSNSYGHQNVESDLSAPLSPSVPHSASQLPDSALPGAGSMYGDLAVPESAATPKQAMAILSTTVVPAKANMTWSSDEDEEEEAMARAAPETARRISLSDTFSMNKNKAPPRIASLEDPEPSVSHIDDMSVLKERYAALEHEINDLKAQNEDARTLIDTLTQEKDAYLEEKSTLPSHEEYSVLQEELESLRSANAALRLENQNIKATKRRDSKALSRDLSISSPTAAAIAAVPLPTSAPVDVNAELRKLYEKLDLISVKPSSPQTNLKEELLRNEALQWQRKYENVQSKDRVSSIKLPSNDLQNYISPTGQISIKRAAKFFSLVETFIESVSDKNSDADLLFEKISSIALAANKISSTTSSASPDLQNQGNSNAIREAASHALTATRYYATYNNLMPRVIVERAVSEIAFTVCDHISVAKLKLDDGLSVNESSFLSQNDTSHMDGVRPLKISSRSGPESKASNRGFEQQDILPKESSKLGPASIPILSAQDSKRGIAPQGSQSVDRSMSIPETNDTGDAPSKNTNITPLLGKIANLFSGASKSETTQPLSTTGKRISTEPEVDNEKENLYETHGSPLMAKPSILEKVKHFESQQDLESQKSKRASFSPTYSSKSRFSDDFSNASQQEGTASKAIGTTKARTSSDTVDEAASIASDTTPTRSKSIFQSLRERFTGDNQKNETPNGHNEALKASKSMNDDITPKVLKSMLIDSGRNEEFHDVSDTPTFAKKIQSSLPVDVNNSKSLGISLTQDKNATSEKPPMADSATANVKPATLGQAFVPEKVTPASKDTTEAQEKPTKSFVPDKAMGLASVGAAGVAAAVGAIALNTKPSEEKSIETNKPLQGAAETGSSNETIRAPALVGDSLTETKRAITTGLGAIKQEASTSLNSAKNSIEQHVDLVSQGASDSTKAFIPPLNNTNQADRGPEYSVGPGAFKVELKDEVDNGSTIKPAGPESEQDEPIERSLSQGKPVEKLSSIKNFFSGKAISDKKFSVKRVISGDKLNDSGMAESDNHKLSFTEEVENSHHIEAKPIKIEQIKQEVDDNVQPEKPSTRVYESEKKPESTKATGRTTFAPNASVILSNGAGIDGDEEESDYDEEQDEARQRQDYRKSMAAATFNIDLFNIDDPDNTLTQLLLYLEHQTVQVILTIQDLLSAIKKPDVSRGELRGNSSAISEVIRQMTEATNTSMNQTRNHQLKEHGSWVVRSLEDCNHRMNALCKPTAEKTDQEFADRHFKQRLAGISFDIAKCTKELVKTVEEASIKEDIAQLDARINQVDDLT